MNDYLKKNNVLPQICRVCGKKNIVYLLKYQNMPKSAQYLPDSKSLEHDKGEDLEVCQCLNCGLVQLSNEPVPYYKEVLRATAFSSEMSVFRQKQFKIFVKKYSLKGKRIIEIGCGRGEYMAIMKETGTNIYGLEYSKDSVNTCVNNGLKVSVGYPENSQQEFENAPFDAFLIMSFLEHLPAPNETLQCICNNLNDDAVGLVEVPNFDMILRKNLFSEFISDHLFYFTEETLCKTLTSNGFEILSCKNVWYDYIISATVRKRKMVNVKKFRTFQNKIQLELNKYIEKFHERGVAIWGAGHQSLALIALANLHERIRYVVDSAPFKQGKFTPATHIPILAPKNLYDNPVDAVIVMAAAYSGEVLRILQNDYQHIPHLSVMEDKGLKIIC